VSDNLEGYVGHSEEEEGMKLRIAWKSCSNNPQGIDFSYANQ
jgi:hypothetical protein